MTDERSGGSGSSGGSGPGVMVFAGLGLLNATSLLLGMAIGWFVDRALHTLPLFLLIGLVVGIVIGAFATRSELKRHT